MIWCLIGFQSFGALATGASMGATAKNFGSVKAKNGRGFSGPSVVLSLLFIMILYSPYVVDAGTGNCSSVGSHTIARSNMHFRITGPTLELLPVINGEVDSSISVRWTLDTIVERAKVNHTADGTSLGTNYTNVLPYITFNPFSPLTFDPVEPYIPNKNCTGRPLPCGPVIHQLKSSELDCWAETQTSQYHGHLRESIYIHYSHPDYPNFKFVSANHVLDSDLIVPFNTTGLAAFERYVKDSLKQEYIWENFPWQGDDNIEYFESSHNNGSVMSFWTNLSIYIPYDVNGSITTDLYSRNISIVGNTVPLNAFIEISTIYSADGFSWAYEFDPLEAVGRFPYGMIFQTQIQNIAEHGSVGHWSQLFYDPNFGNLVAPPIDSLGSEPQKKVGKLPNWAAALIAVGGVLVVITVIILVFTLVPKAKDIIRPFTSRSSLARDSKRDSAQSASRWTSGSKPEH